MATTPRYLFRTSSAQSAGTNTRNLFVPASLSGNGVTDHNADFIALAPEINFTSHSSFGQQLRQALLWKKSPKEPGFPFVFFTTSPSFAVQLAVWRSQRKGFRDGSVVEADENVTITIIDTTTATTSSGEQVSFRSVRDLINEHDIDLRNRSDNSVRKYTDQWVSMSEVHLGPGSFHADFKELVENGFYELYPQVEVANQRKDPRINLTSVDLRKFGFEATGKGWGVLGVQESMDTAGRLALAFGSCVQEEGGNEEDDDDDGDDEEDGDDWDGAGTAVKLAFVLALRERDVDDLDFALWLQEHTSQVPRTGIYHSTSNITPLEDNISDATHVQCLHQYFATLRFDSESMAIGFRILPDVIEEEKQKWLDWWRKDRDEYRQAHPRGQQQQHQGRKSWKERRAERKMELSEGRAMRQDSVLQTPTVRREQPRELFQPAQQRGVRELFPNRDQATYGQHHGASTPATRYRRRPQNDLQVLPSRAHDHVTTAHQYRDTSYHGRPYNDVRSYAADFQQRQGLGQGGLRVISSRPGDAVTTQHQHQRADGAVRRRDRDREPMLRRRSWRGGEIGY